MSAVAPRRRISLLHIALDDPASGAGDVTQCRCRRGVVCSRYALCSNMIHGPADCPVERESALDDDRAPRGRSLRLHPTGTVPSMSETAPFGSWRSPISALSVADDDVPLLEISCVGDDVYWLEGRPRDGGRYVLMRLSAGGEKAEITPKPFNVRTRVHRVRRWVVPRNRVEHLLREFRRPTPVSPRHRRPGRTDHTRTGIPVGRPLR